MTHVYILSAVRTAIGSFGGRLKDSAPIDLVSAPLRRRLRDLVLLLLK